MHALQSRRRPIYPTHTQRAYSFARTDPYFSHIGNKRDVQLDYAVGNTGHSVGGNTYGSLLHALVACTRAALDRLDPSFAAIPIVVGETGQ